MSISMDYHDVLSVNIDKSSNSDRAWWTFTFYFADGKSQEVSVWPQHEGVVKLTIGEEE